MKKWKMKIVADEKKKDVELQGRSMELLATLLTVTQEVLLKCAPDEEAYYRVKYAFIHVLKENAKWEEKK